MRFISSIAKPLVLALGGVSVHLATAQQVPFEKPDAFVAGAVELLLEQASQLRQGGRDGEALDVLVRLQGEQLVHSRSGGFANSGLFNEDWLSGTLVQKGGVQRAGTLSLRRFIPLRERIGSDIAGILNSGSDEAEAYVRRLEGLSAGRLREVQVNHKVEAATDNAIRFMPTSDGWKHALVAADICLENGWPLAAVEAMQRIDPDLSCELESLALAADSGYQPTGRIAWPVVFRSSAAGDVAGKTALHDSLRDRLLQLGKRLNQKNPALLKELAYRYLVAAEMAPDEMDVVGTRRWLEIWSAMLVDDNTVQGDDIGQMLADESLQHVASQLQSEQGSWDMSWPLWSENLPTHWSTADSTPASKPRVCELDEANLPYFPTVHDGLVLLHELTRIRAFDLRTGKAWPEGSEQGVLLDTLVDPVAFVPHGYPLVGVPRASLAAAGHIVYARMGSPITGWANRDTGGLGMSNSQLVAIDLEHQGQMLDGFPIRLSDEDFDNGEFEGPPLVWGELLIVAVAERGGAGLRRSLASFNRFSGQPVWRSVGLASGIVAGAEKANMIAHQQIVAAGGRLFYNTNLGSIACLDPSTGQLKWLSQYSRLDRSRQSVRTPDRYLYRDCTPCLVAGGLVYCAPSDCGEIFALDVVRGDLVWSTHHDDAPDAMHWTGVTEESLIVGGDQLVWLDRWSGKMLARYPGSNTPGLVNSLPQPRGLGQPVLAGSKVYFPVEGEILVFDADLPRKQESLVAVPSVLERFDLDSRGRQGGNLSVHQSLLIMASPGRLMVFR